MRKASAVIVSILSVGALLTACSATSPETEGPAGEAQVPLELTYAAAIGADTSLGKEAQSLMSAITKATDGAITFQPFWASSLVPGDQLLDAVQDGRVDSAMVPSPYEPDTLPFLSIVSIPFLTNSAEAQVRAVTDLYAQGGVFKEQFDKQGLQVLGFNSATTPSVLGVKEPVNSLSDLAGQRIRSSGLQGEALAELGVQPVSLAFGEIYESVERGVVDGFFGVPFELAVSSGLTEVTPYLVDTGFGNFAINVAMVMKKDTFDGLTPETQEALLAIGSDLIDPWLLDLAAAEKAACKKFLDDGGTVTVISTLESTTWKQSAQAKVIERWRDDVEAAGWSRKDGEAFYKDYVDAIAQYDTDDATYTDGFRACGDS